MVPGSTQVRRHAAVVRQLVPCYWYTLRHQVYKDDPGGRDHREGKGPQWSLKSRTRFPRNSLCPYRCTRQVTGRNPKQVFTKPAAGLLSFLSIPYLFPLSFFARKRDTILRFLFHVAVLLPLCRTFSASFVYVCVCVCVIQQRVAPVTSL